MTQLMALLGAAQGGAPQLGLIHGQAGIGKTRLAEEVGERARARGSRFVLGRGWQDGEAPPLWPWRAILRGLGAPADLLEERPGQASGRFARFVAVLDHLRAVASTAPLLIVLDDAHLADAATLLLAAFLAREPQLPMLLLLTCRDETRGPAPEVAELLSELGRTAVAIPLAGLSEQAVGAYLATVTEPMDADLVRVVAAVTKGNPLHLRSIAIQGPSDVGGMHGGIERAIRAPLERLSGLDRRLIGVAALLGPDVSVYEVARVADISPAAAAAALSRAVEVGLASPAGADRFRFVHELVRREVASCLTPGESLDAHARAAAVLRGHHPDRISRRAHHALAAASRSHEDAQRAVQIAREAARSLKAVDGFEAAVALLGRAAEIQAAAAPASPTAELIVEQAEAVLACGRLAESRPLFQHAARVAELEGDPVALGRAALGLGGIWVSEHRRTDEAEQVLALERKALETLPATATVLRARLGMRLAAEQAYRGGELGPVFDGMEAARRNGDAQARAEALSLAHHALFTPEHTWRRLAMANEMIAAAASAGDGLLSLVGLCWRAVDLFLLGDGAAGAALEDLRVRAEALRCRGILFIVRAMEVMLAIRAADFDRAEAAAAACAALGFEAGDEDARAYHVAHLSAIRYFQGREAELADLAASVAASSTLLEERDRSLRAAGALFALRAGQPKPARALLQRLTRDGLHSVPSASTWLPTLVAVVELAFALGDAHIAQVAYDALLPYAGLPVMGSLAVVCFGSVHRSLGLAALACGKLDLAIEHLTAAVAANEELGHRPAAIQAQAELGLARRRRAQGGEDAHGRALLQDAIAAGEAAGMSALAARWREAAESLPLAAAASEAPAARMSSAPGGMWHVAWDGQVAVVPDRIGMRYLLQLVNAPDRGIRALALVMQGAVERVDHGPDAVMDRKAMAALWDRIRDLRGRAALPASEREELAALTRELARATGLGGRARSFAGAPERARIAVRKAIKRAIDEISLANASVGQHLARHVETGAVCCYHIEPRHNPGTVNAGNPPTPDNALEAPVQDAWTLELPASGEARSSPEARAAGT